MLSFTPKQLRFIDEYLIDRNATKAAIRSGYSIKSARISASKNMSKANILGEIQARTRDLLDQSEMKKEELILACAEVIRACVTDYINPDTGLLELTKYSPNQRAIDSYKEHHYTDKQGVEHIYKTIKLVAKSAYIEQASKLLGIDKTTVDREINVNIKVVGENQVEIIHEDEQ